MPSQPSRFSGPLAALLADPNRLRNMGGSFREAGNQITMLPNLAFGTGTPAVSSPPPVTPATHMPTGTNLSSYFAPETPDNFMGSGIQGAPFQMGPGTAWPFGASWQAILQG